MTNEEFVKSPAGVVQELRGQYNAHIANSALGLEHYDTGKAQAIVWALLCRAIIDEATISTVTVTTTEHYDELCRPTDPNRICTMSSTISCNPWVPEGEYRLVKQEE
jgi:hypothetical protein